MIVKKKGGHITTSNCTNKSSVRNCKSKSEIIRDMLYKCQFIFNWHIFDVRAQKSSNETMYKASRINFNMTTNTLPVYLQEFRNI